MTQAEVSGNEPVASVHLVLQGSQTGAQITRRNLNVQPTIKVPAGYKFTVRVNRDILFEAPYELDSSDVAPRTAFIHPEALR